MSRRITDGLMCRRTVWPLACVVLVVCAACARDAPVPATRAAVRPTYDPASGRLTGLAFDADGDARFELMARMEGRDLRRVDVDENGDGVPERREHYAATSPREVRSPDPQLSLVEQLDASGTIRRREGYDGGQLAWAEEDRDRDGTMDRHETWARGALTSVTIARAASASPLRIVYPASPGDRADLGARPALPFGVRSRTGR